MSQSKPSHNSQWESLNTKGLVRILRGVNLSSETELWVAVGQQGNGRKGCSDVKGVKRYWQLKGKGVWGIARARMGLW